MTRPRSIPEADWQVLKKYPGHWHVLPGWYLRVWYSRKQHGWLAAKHERGRMDDSTFRWPFAGCNLTGIAVTLVGKFATPELALQAAADSIGIGDERLCKAGDIDAVR